MDYLKAECARAINERNYSEEACGNVTVLSVDTFYKYPLYANREIKAFQESMSNRKIEIIVRGSGMSSFFEINGQTPDSLSKDSADVLMKRLEEEEEEGKERLRKKLKTRFDAFRVVAICDDSIKRVYRVSESFFSAEEVDEVALEKEDLINRLYEIY